MNGWTVPRVVSVGLSARALCIFESYVDCIFCGSDSDLGIFYSFVE